MSTSGLSNKMNSKLCWDPILARLSVRLLVSQKQCLIRFWRNWDVRCLQSSTRGELAKSELLVLVNRSTITLATISTSTTRKFLARQIVSPSARRAQSSAIKLEALPMFLVNLITQFPLSSLTNPPSPARPKVSDSHQISFWVILDGGETIIFSYLAILALLDIFFWVHKREFIEIKYNIHN